MAGAVVVMGVVVFLAGMLVGVIAALAMGIGRADHRYPLTGEASGRLGTITRRLNGLGHRDLHIPPGGPLSH